MAPWSAAIQAVLGVAVLVLFEPPSPARVWTVRALAASAGVLGAVFLAENLTGRPVGLDQVFFSDALMAAGQSWPGRPSAWTAFSAVMLAVAIALTRHSRQWARITWRVCLIAAAVLPTITALRYMFEAVLLLDATRASGQAVGSVVSLLLLVAATSIACPDEDLFNRLLARPDRWPLIRLVALMAALPIAMGISRLAFLKVGLQGDGVWVLAITVGVVAVGMAVFFTSQRELGLLIEKEAFSRQTAQAERQRAQAESQRAEAERERAEAESQRAEAERERTDAQRLYRALLEAAPDALIIVGLDGRIILANAQADQMFGYSREEIVGSEVEKFIPQRYRGNHVRHRSDFFAAPSVRPIGAGQQLWGLRHDGEEFPVSISVSPLSTQNGLRVLASIRDVTERYEIEERLRVEHEQLVEAQHGLERLARFDSLTGLFNRGETLARLEFALTCNRTPGTEFGVLFCDVDKFKTINDTWGHDVGDAVLLTVADRISQCVRHGDTVGRTGGDEILVLLPGLHSLAEAIQIADKIKARTAAPIHHSGSTFHATLSIGATLAIPGESATDTTTRADAAMYQAKHAGGNTVSHI